MNIAGSPEVQRFADDAKAYCSFVEGLRSRKPETMYSQLLSLLSNLAVSALGIPFDMPDCDPVVSFDLTHDERAAISRMLSETVHTEVSRLPLETSNDGDAELPRLVMYFDDLSDIYCDIKAGFRAFESGTLDGQSEAIWQWKWGYENHWGHHLMRALQTTHEIRFELYVE